MITRNKITISVVMSFLLILILFLLLTNKKCYKNTNNQFVKIDTTCVPKSSLTDCGYSIQEEVLILEITSRKFDHIVDSIYFKMSNLYQLENYEVIALITVINSLHLTGLDYRELLKKRNSKLVMIEELYWKYYHQYLQCNYSYCEENKKSGIEYYPDLAIQVGGSYRNIGEKCRVYYVCDISFKKEKMFAKVIDVYDYLGKGKN